MKYCKHCGTPLDDDTVFCSTCGTNQTNAKSNSNTKQNYNNNANNNSDTSQNKNTDYGKKDENENLFGILSIIFGVVCPIAGLIIAIYGMKKENCTPKNNTLCKVGLGISIAMICFSFISSLHGVASYFFTMLTWRI